MTRLLLLFGCLCLLGCSDNASICQEYREETRLAKEKVVGKKVVNIRASESAIDFIMEDGNIVTVFAYVVAGGRVHTSLERNSYRVGMK